MRSSKLISLNVTFALDFSQPDIKSSDFSRKVVIVFFMAVFRKRMGVWNRNLMVVAEERIDRTARELD